MYRAKSLLKNNDGPLLLLSVAEWILVNPWSPCKIPWRIKLQF